MQTKWMVYVLMGQRNGPPPRDGENVNPAVWDLLSWNTRLESVWSELLTRVGPKPPEGGLPYTAYVIQSVSHRDFTLRWTTQAVDSLLREMLEPGGVQGLPIIKVQQRHGPFLESFDVFEVKQ